MSNGSEFNRLVDIMARLRAPGGCPWDRAQSRDDLKSYLLEETYEVLEAIDSGDPDKLREELGDLLLQVVFHAQISTEEGDFTIEDVAAAINEKLVRRHPHVFGDVEVETKEQVLENWEKIKREERREKEKPDGLLSGVPPSLPALLKAYRLQQKAAGAGFDWEETAQVKEKVLEEWGELQGAIESENRRAVMEEFGDLLFALVNLARFLGFDAEDALQQANNKFITRFHEVEKLADSGERDLHDMKLEEMDILWERAKSLEGGTGKGNSSVKSPIDKAE